MIDFAHLCCWTGCRVDDEPRSAAAAAPAGLPADRGIQGIRQA